MTNKEQLLADIKKGWETLGYAQRMYWADRTGERTMQREKVACACALGAAAFARGYLHPLSFAHHLPDELAGAITRANDSVDMQDLTHEELKTRSLEAIDAAITKWEAELNHTG
jgi:epoxyqueuosine reductase QueG